MAKNVAQPIFCQNQYVTFFLPWPTFLGYFFKFKKMPEIKNGPMCENSPNLVALHRTTISQLANRIILGTYVRRYRHIFKFWFCPSLTKLPKYILIDFSSNVTYVKSVAFLPANFLRILVRLDLRSG
jgi:hypothetical protein